MKIDLKQLLEGATVTLVESENPQGLDLEATGIQISSPIEIKAQVTKLQDTLDIKIALKTEAALQCSRCLNETDIVISKNMRLDYTITTQDTTIDISEDIRQELMLEYPLKPLCSLECKGLCVTCGKNLNEGPCGCKKP